jgi:hypothetical protein
MTHPDQSNGSDRKVSQEAPDFGYAEAFYEIAGMLGIGAQPYSPKQVWETQVRPTLQALLAPTAYEDIARANQRSSDEWRAKYEEAMKLLVGLHAAIEDDRYNPDAASLRYAWAKSDGVSEYLQGVQAVVGEE